MVEDTRTKREKPEGRERRPGLTPALQVVNANAAGIDVGARTHYVAVPADRDRQPVRHFGCLTPDLLEMARWLKGCGVQTVAMEATGVYWVPVAQVLESQGLEVVLVDASDLRNVKGRKSDVQDCQWAQQLHTYGLLKGAFRPTRQVQVLRGYWRHRQTLVDGCAQQIHRMQKALEQMNVQLHKALSDISGVTGMKILRAILAGERDGAVLARRRDGRLKCSEETLVKALTGDWRPEHLFALKQAVELYDVYQQKIAECDAEIEKVMAPIQAQPVRGTRNPKASKKRAASRRKNQCHFDLGQELFRLAGVDVTRIDGIDALTAQTVFSELGFDLSAFPSEKHFASWTRLCPNNRITGGRIRSSRTRPGSNRVALAFRRAAQSLHHSHSALGGFYRRMVGRIGPGKATTAVAHKVARLFYRMVRHGQDYVDQGEKEYQQRYQQQQMRLLKKRARQMGFDLVARDTGTVVS
jgi:transposase